MSKIAKNLFMFRTKYNLTQRQLADRIGVSREIINRIENNKANPTYDMIERLAINFNITPSKLID